MNILLIGFMGTGKSTVSAVLAQRLGFRSVEMDEEIAAKAGMSIPEIFASEGEAGFRARETEELAAVLSGDGQVVSCGGGIVTRERNLSMLRSAAASTVRLTASPEAVFERIGSDPGRPMLKDVRGPEDMARLMESREAAYRAAGGVEIATDRKTPEEIADEIMVRLGLSGSGNRSEEI